LCVGSLAHLDLEMTATMSKKTTTELPQGTASAFIPDEANQSDLAADILRGCAKIAAFTGESERTTYYRLENGQLPALKQGREWISTKSRLRRHYNETTYEPPPKPEPAEPSPIRRPAQTRRRGAGR
jgi:hypothetical protein